MLQQRPPGDRALPRVRDGPADRRRGELLLRQGRPPRPDRPRAAARHAAAGQQGRPPTEILATGFRAPNGVCLNPDGTFFLTDQEGFWIPEEPDQPASSAAASTATCGAITTSPTPPTRRWSRRVCWITNAFDRSPAELLRVTGDRLGPAQGVAAEPLLRLRQGLRRAARRGRRRGCRAGCAALPLPQFPTGVMRGPVPPGRRPALRLRHVRLGRQPDPARRLLPRPLHGQADVHLPVGLHARKGSMAITFSGPLDRETASDPDATPPGSGR